VPISPHVHFEPDIHQGRQIKLFGLRIFWLKILGSVSRVETKVTTSQYQVGKKKKKKSFI
jgi:hypothetical protein